MCTGRGFEVNMGDRVATEPLWEKGFQTSNKEFIVSNLVGISVRKELQPERTYGTFFLSRTGNILIACSMYMYSTYVRTVRRGGYMIHFPLCTSYHLASSSCRRREMEEDAGWVGGMERRHQNGVC